MPKRESENLTIVETYRPEYDSLIQACDPEQEARGMSGSDLRCGQDGKLLLRNFSVEEAQNCFRMEGRRAVIKCPACGSYNLLAAAVEKNSEGGWVDLPNRE